MRSERSLINVNLDLYVHVNFLKILVCHKKIEIFDLNKYA